MDPDLKWDIPNRRFLCEICVEWFSFDDAYEDSVGDKWNLCGPCGKEQDA